MVASETPPQNNESRQSRELFVFLGVIALTLLLGGGFFVWQFFPKQGEAPPSPLPAPSPVVAPSPVEFKVSDTLPPMGTLSALSGNLVGVSYAHDASGMLPDIPLIEVRVFDPLTQTDITKPFRIDRDTLVVIPPSPDPFAMGPFPPAGEGAPLLKPEELPLERPVSVYFSSDARVPFPYATVIEFQTFLPAVDLP